MWSALSLGTAIPYPGEIYRTLRALPELEVSEKARSDFCAGVRRHAQRLRGSFREEKSGQRQVNKTCIPPASSSTHMPIGAALQLRNHNR